MLKWTALRIHYMSAQIPACNTNQHCLLSDNARFPMRNRFRCSENSFFFKYFFCCLYGISSFISSVLSCATSVCMYGVSIKFDEKKARTQTCITIAFPMYYVCVYGLASKRYSTGRKCQLRSVNKKRKKSRHSHKRNIWTVP